MDELARKNGLGHWSCVSPLNSLFWLRSDGLSIKLLDDSSPIIGNLDWYDDNETKGEDWQQPEQSLKADILHDKAYFNGLVAGWNFAVNNNEDGFDNALSSLRNNIEAEIDKEIQGIIDIPDNNLFIDGTPDKDQENEIKNTRSVINNSISIKDWRQPTPDQPIRNNALTKIQDMLSTCTGVTNHQFFDAEICGEIVKGIADRVAQEKTIVATSCYDCPFKITRPLNGLVVDDTCWLDNDVSIIFDDPEYYPDNCPLLTYTIKVVKIEK